MAAKENILVVDDEPSIRKYLQTLLEVDGFGVETVTSGKEALEKIGTGENRPDFIILQCGVDSMEGDPITHLHFSPEVHRSVAREKSQRMPKVKTDREWDCVLLVLMNHRYETYEIWEADRATLLPELGSVGMPVLQFKGLGHQLWPSTG